MLNSEASILFAPLLILNVLRTCFPKISIISRVDEFSKPEFKVFFENRLFNYHHLKQSDEVICLVSISKLWKSNTLNYNLIIKEIMLLKQ